MLAEWYHLGWLVLDAVLAELGEAAEPNVVQLWPEHLDAGCDIAVGSSERVNLGASPGDSHLPHPYFYVQPWSAARPGPPDFWNASFGAVLGYPELLASADPQADAGEFLRTGIGFFES